MAEGLSRLLDGAVEISLPHGYTLADLHKITLCAIMQARWRLTPFDERYEVARFAVIERLYDTSEAVPQWHDLVNTGKRAIMRYLDDYFCEHGQDLKNIVLSDISRPRFCMYWREQTAPSPSPENHVVDILAVCQIWPKLTPRNKRVLRMLAVYGDYDSAARALGVSRDTYINKLSEARKQFLRLWHEGEPPSRIWGRDHKGIFGYEPSQAITTITRQRGKRRKISQA
jgi:DNA-binding protein Fis